MFCWYLAGFYFKNEEKNQLFNGTHYYISLGSHWLFRYALAITDALCFHHETIT